MSARILLVFEGARTEPAIFNKVREHFFSRENSSLIYSCFDAELYQLCQQVKEDEFVELIELLRERDSGNQELLNNEFSEIHLFFDHDAHSHPELNREEYHKMIEEILVIFDNETENGKLYLSYPMIEAIRDCRLLPDEGYECSCFQDISENTDYKTLVGERTTFNPGNKEEWLDIIGINYVKAKRLVDDSIEPISNYDEISLYTQEGIYAAQYEKHISTRHEVMILSAVPFFILEYFGRPLFESIPFDRIDISCRYFCS